MKRTILLSFIAYCVCLSGAMAGGGNDVSSLNSAWGGGAMDTCNGLDIKGTEACISFSQKVNCKNLRTGSRTGGIQMMIARTVTAYGAKFCPTLAEGVLEKHTYQWTVTGYVDLTRGNDSQCVWLCKKGYTGPNCEESIDASTSCDVSKLERNNYSSLPLKPSGNSIEDSVAMFAFNVNSMCGVRWFWGGTMFNYNSEHDMILAITRYLPSGHGAWVRQMIVRSENYYIEKKAAGVKVYPAQNSSEILVCKNGYTVNAAGTDCQEINPVICKLQQTCTGWSSGFDENLHRFVQVDGETCFQYRCIEPGQAFASDTNRSSCIDCVDNMRSGISPIDGVCVKCDVGKIFDATAKSSGFCVPTQSFSKTDLQYGKGKSKNTVPLNEQCWSLLLLGDYKACVFGETQDLTFPQKQIQIKREMLPNLNKNVALKTID